MFEKQESLGKHVTILSGFPFKSNLFGDVGKMPIIRIRDVTRGYSTTFYAGEYDSKFVVHNGDLLVGMDGEFNRETWSGGPALLNQRVCKLTPSSSNLHHRYLYHYLPLALQQIEDETPFVTVKHLSVKSIETIQIPLPPLSEQKRIAEILDRAEALRAKRRAALTLIDELTQSIFLDMFGDPVRASGTDTVTLEDVADLITGFAFKSSEFVQTGDSVRLCRGANVLPSTLDWSDVVFWPKDRVAEVDKFLLTPGDVIIAMDRPWISSGFKIAQVKAEDCPALLVQRVARLRGRTVTNNFLYALLKQPAFTRHCKPTETTIPHISPTDIRTFAFCMPGSEVLRRFDARLATIAKIRSSVIESEVLSDQLFASLQHRAFRGEL
jgi:type I restriction enzyme S subunit